MIRLEHVSKVFASRRKKVVALNDISFCLPQKGIVFIVGKSGSGKSTLLNLMAGFEKPSEGHIFFNGEDITTYNDKEKNEYHLYDMGFVFQNYALLENLSVEDNIALAFKEKASLHQKEIDSLLKKVLLEGYQKRKVKYLSGGEKQRVALARALIMHPKVIFFDEPTGNLDYRSSRQILSIMKEVSKDTLLVIVSHNLNDASTYGDRILSLEDGKLISDVSYDEKNKEKDCVYLSNLDELDDKEIRLLDEKMQDEKKRIIKSRKDLFQKTEVIEDKPIEKNERHSCHVFSLGKAILKTLNQNKLRLFLIPFFLSICCSLFSCIYSLSDLKNTDYVSKIVDNRMQDSFFVDSSIAKDDGSAYNSAIYPVSGNYVSQIENLTLNGEHAKVYKFPFSNNKKNYSLYYHRMVPLYNSFISVDNFIDFYSQSNTGLLLGDESFVKKILSLNKLEFLSESNKKQDDGVYITDYFADSILHYSKSYTSYDSLLGLVKDAGLSYCYINGIIKTDYKKRLAQFKKELDEKKAISILLEDRFSNEYNYLFHGLNYFYSFNLNFFEAYDNDYDIKKDSIQLCGIDLKEKEYIFYEDYHQSRCLVPLSRLKDDEIGIPYSSLTYYLKTNDKEAINKIVDEINKKGGITFSLSLVTSSSVDYTNNFEDTYSLNLKIRPLDIGNKSSFTVFAFSKDVYMTLRQKDEFCFGYHFSDLTDAKKVMSALKGEPVFLSSSRYFIQSKIITGMIRVSSTFTFLAYISLALVVLLILYYALSSVHSQFYSLAIFQSLGYSKKEIALFYLAEIVLSTLLTGIFYYAFYQILHRATNQMIVKGIFVSLENSTYLTIISFSNPFYLFGMLSIFVSMTLATLFYLWLILKKQSIHNLQSKE